MLGVVYLIVCWLHNSQETVTCIFLFAARVGILNEWMCAVDYLILFPPLLSIVLPRALIADITIPPNTVY